MVHLVYSDCRTTERPVNMWTSQVLTPLSFFGVLTSVLSTEIKNLHDRIHSNDPKTFKEHKPDLNTLNEHLVYPYNGRNVNFNNLNVQGADPKFDNDAHRANRVARSINDDDKQFARELRDLLRDTRATYAGSTKLMNRDHTTAKKKMFVRQEKVVMERGVNSEQIAQLLKSSEELARDGTRLPLWGVPSTPSDGRPTTEPPTVDMVRELRELLRNSRGTFATTLLMNREHTKAKKKMFVPQDKVVVERGVNSEQLAEIVKSSEERNPAVKPLIGMTTSNYTLPTVGIRDFIRELRALFRESRATFDYTTRRMNQAENTSPRRKLKGKVDPEFARYQVGSHQFEEILKSSEERANPSKFPLIGA